MPSKSGFILLLSGLILVALICYQMSLFISVYDAGRIDVSTSIFRGVFESANFPVERFGPAPAIGDTRKYLNLDVLVLED